MSARGDIVGSRATREARDERRAADEEGEPRSEARRHRSLRRHGTRGCTQNGLLEGDRSRSWAPPNGGRSDGERTSTCGEQRLQRGGDMTAWGRAEASSGAACGRCSRGEQRRHGLGAGGPPRGLECAGGVTLCSCPARTEVVRGGRTVLRSPPPAARDPHVLVRRTRTMEYAGAPCAAPRPPRLFARVSLRLSLHRCLTERISFPNSAPADLLREEDELTPCAAARRRSGVGLLAFVGPRYHNSG